MQMLERKRTELEQYLELEVPESELELEQGRMWVQVLEHEFEQWPVLVWPQNENLRKLEQELELLTKPVLVF